MACKDKKVFEKNCLFCGNTFLAHHKAIMYCSANCKNEANASQRLVHNYQCKNCGKLFTTRQKGQAFCSLSCSSQWHGKSVRKQRICKYCGGQFFNGNGHDPQYCSRQCAIYARFGTPEERNARVSERQKLQEKRPKPVCFFCWKPYDRNSPNQQYCSHECMYMASLNNKREQWKEAYRPRTFRCEECGTLVTTQCKDTHSKFCSESCAKKYGRRMEHQTIRHKELTKRQKIIRKQQIRDNYIEPVSYSAIFKRANGICGICGLPVLYDKHIDNNWSGTIDHIVPLSLGGEHSMKNCQLAHRVCNSLKGKCDGAVRIDWPEKAQEDNYWRLKYEHGMEVLRDLLARACPSQISS